MATAVAHGSADRKPTGSASQVLDKADARPRLAWVAIMHGKQ